MRTGLASGKSPRIEPTAYNLISFVTVYEVYCRSRYRSGRLTITFESYNYDSLPELFHLLFLFTTTLLTYSNALAMSSSSIQISSQPNGGTNPLEVSPPKTLDVVRCSRCQRSLSVPDDKAQGAVQFGMNSYYCHRCASKVGFIR